MTRPRPSKQALPPGPGLSTARMRAQIQARAAGQKRGVLSAFARLFADLDGPRSQPVTHAEKFAAGGAVRMPKPVGEVLHPDELGKWHARAEFPVVRAAEDGYAIASGENIYARALGAGAREVDTVLVADGTMHVMPLRLTPGITRQQVSSAVLGIKDSPDLEDIIRSGMRAAALSNANRANAQVEGLGYGRPFKTIPGPFRAAIEPAYQSAQDAIETGRTEMIQAMYTLANPPRALRESDIGHEESKVARTAVAERGDIAGRTAARAADQEAHEADITATRTRHEELGIKRYMWISSRDERVRKRHKELDRTIHDWSDPPVVDPKTGRRCHPGEDYGPCRCTASPLVDDIMSALDNL